MFKTCRWGEKIPTLVGNSDTAQDSFCLNFLVLRQLDKCRREAGKYLALQNNIISFAENGWRSVSRTSENKPYVCALPRYAVLMMNFSLGKQELMASQEWGQTHYWSTSMALPCLLWVIFCPKRRSVRDENPAAHTSRVHTLLWVNTTVLDPFLFHSENLSWWPKKSKACGQKPCCGYRASSWPKSCIWQHKIRSRVRAMCLTHHSQSSGDRLLLITPATSIRIFSFGPGS